MALRNTAPLDDWISREQPSAAAQRAASGFLERIATAPWSAPSWPIIELSEQPTFELRGVSVPVLGESPVHIWYRHYYAGDDIDLIAVTNR